MKTFKIVMIAVACCTILSCDKDFLGKKPDKALLVPKRAEDLRALMDNIEVMNTAPGLGAIASDDYYVTDAGWQGLPVIEKNSYLWAEDVYQGSSFVLDWSRPYQQVFYCNIVLEALDKLEDKSNTENQQLKGTALFFRSLAYYNLAQIFTVPYDVATALNESGIPIRLSSDVNDRPGRGTLKETYDRIITDLSDAEKLLPPQVAYKSRPDKAAANALLARIYLNMGDYDMAGTYAGACLQLKNTLLDYSILNAAALRPFPVVLPDANEEVLFYSTLINYSFITSATVPIADPALYRSYDANDLRKTLLFRDRGLGVITFKGSYTGHGISGSNSGIFSGLATDEVYLIRAEAYARKGNIPDALTDLNTLLQKRWKQGTFVPVTAGTAEEVLQRILTERRKELVGRGTRWSDLRRLNKEAASSVVLKRAINGEERVLAPQDKRYTFPLPQNELTDDIQQNPR
jgi:starch-binding outer membrane protein, SusD/RagB family